MEGLNAVGDVDEQPHSMKHRRHTYMEREDGVDRGSSRDESLADNLPAPMVRQRGNAQQK